MKPEQKAGMIFTGFGIVMGLFSDLIGMLYVALIAPPVIYIGMVFLMTKIEKSKPLKWAVSNSVLIFLLTWMIVWIIFYNMR